MEASCPYGNSFDIMCPGDLPGVISYTCPTYNMTPTCASLNALSMDEFECTTTSFSNTHTDCICTSSMTLSPASLPDSLLKYSLISVLESASSEKSFSIVLFSPPERVASNVLGM